MQSAANRVTSGTVPARWLIRSTSVRLAVRLARASRRACDSPRPERTRGAAGEPEPLYRQENEDFGSLRIGVVVAFSSACDSWLLRAPGKVPRGRAHQRVPISGAATEEERPASGWCARWGRLRQVGAFFEPRGFRETLDLNSAWLLA